VHATNPARVSLHGSALDVRVFSHETEPLADADLRRLFAGSTLTAQRLDRLRSWPLIAVTFDSRIVGLASCQKNGPEMRVPDVAVDAITPLQAGGVLRVGEREIADALLDAIETAAVAAGCRRVVVNPPKMPLPHLQRRGYRYIDERCAGGWFEKTLLIA
jgi:hypothetical protein